MGTVYSMANQDKEFLSEYAEENFASTILEKFGNLLKNGYHVYILFFFEKKNFFLFKDPSL